MSCDEDGHVSMKYFVVVENSMACEVGGGVYNYTRMRWDILRRNSEGHVHRSCSRWMPCEFVMRRDLEVENDTVSARLEVLWRIKNSTKSVKTC